jgi:protease I
MFGFGKPKKHVVLVLPPKLFDDNELKVIEKSLSHENIKYQIASSMNFAPIEGMLKHKVKPELRCADINLDATDALVFIGGDGARDYWNDFNIHHLIQRANQKGKILAAIDFAVLILAHAEVLHQKKATILETEQHKLETAGAIYTGTPVEVDGNIITGSNTHFTAEFASILAKAVNGEVINHVEKEA